MTHTTKARRRLRIWLNSGRQIKGRIDGDRYDEVLKRLEFQRGHAIVWRDAICDWFQKMSGIPDKQRRVGHHPGRVEAEAMQLDGYVPADVTPWETASGGKAVACEGTKDCAATFNCSGEAGRYDVSVEYFDQNNGVAHYRLLVNQRLADAWSADEHFPSGQMNGQTSTRHTAEVELHPGDVLRIEGRPDKGEPAPLDYVEISAAP